jgi:hypothetical protein
MARLGYCRSQAYSDLLSDGGRQWRVVAMRTIARTTRRGALSRHSPRPWLELELQRGCISDVLAKGPSRTVGETRAAVPMPWTEMGDEDSR